MHENQAIPFAQLSKITGQREANSKILLPHELRRQRRLEKEGLYFKRMTEQIRRQKVEGCTIERVHQPSKEAFVERYMKHGKPAILTGMMDSWESTKSWKFEELGTKRNPPFLIGSWNSINRTFDLLIEHSLEGVAYGSSKGKFFGAISCMHEALAVAVLLFKLSCFSLSIVVPTDTQSNRMMQ